MSMYNLCLDANQKLSSKVQKIDLQEDEDFDIFRKHILPRTCHLGILFCGSFYEQPIKYALLNLTDHDQMFVEPKLIAATNATTTPKCFHGEILTIETKNCHLGFARLLRHCGEKTEYFVGSYNSLDRPAQKRSIMTTPVISDFLGAASQYNIPSLKAITEFIGDFVHSVLCPDWPSEADEWKTRNRNSGWPQRDMIDKIVQVGCHLVPKSYQGNPNDYTSWRYSFSQAELILTDTWNEVQKYIYHILRILKSDVVKKCGDKENTFLCTYYFKTLMFWACEEKPSTFWGEDRIEAAIEELLLQMIQWLIDKNCPNYFMRENNMLEYFQSDFDFGKEVSLLLDACQAISTVISSKPMVYHEKMLHIRFSVKVLLFCQLALNRSFFVNAWSPKRERYAMKNLSASALLRCEVEHLFRAVKLHRLLMSDLSSSEAEICEKWKSYETEALGYYERSIEKKETKNYIDVFVSPLDSLLGIAHKFLNEKPSEHSQRMCCYRRADESNLTKEAMEALGQYILSTLDKAHQNASYFISAAYYANFYYTCLREYGHALDICVKLLNDFNENQNAVGLNLNTFGEEFINEMLCMFINSHYAGIYDAGIGVVFGFLTLCVATIFPNEKSSSDRNLFLHDLVFQMCPVEFLKYIQIRCRNKLQPIESGRHIEKNLFHKIDLKRDLGGNTDLKNLSNFILSAAIIIDSNL